ncbi:MAG: hypothetical protein PF637_11325 [Spirochaetes bacterium]|jgi:hypothetical protein|nr:hypothetical protein [Spirochaetota bacterium]
MNTSQKSRFEDNRVILFLRDQNVFTEESVRRAYRLLSKQTHPDITGKGADDFIRLREEYEQALEGIESLAGYFTAVSRSQTVPDERYCRLMFYLSLKRYITVGLFSVKLRIRESVQRRNRIILEDVVKRAQQYDPSFVSVFLNYNRNHLRRFSIWYNSKHNKNGRIYFIKGISFFLEYQLRGGCELYNIAYSYLEDSLYELSDCEGNSVETAMHDFARWLFDELKQKSLASQLNDKS